MVAKLSWGAVIVFHRSCFGVGSSCWRRMESPEKSSKCGVASIPDDQVEDAMFCVKEVIRTCCSRYYGDASAARTPISCSNSSLSKALPTVVASTDEYEHADRE